MQYNKNNIRAFVLCFLFLSSFQLVVGQTYSPYLVRKVNMKGLPAETYFESITQDDDGFLWIGTLSGLYRYDGSRIIRFLHDPADSNSLTHNYANSLAKDAQGNLWIGTFGSFMNKYDRNSGKIIRIEPAIKTKLREVISKVRLSLDKQNVLAASPKCIFKINTKGNVTDSFLFTANSAMPDLRINDFIEYTNDNFIIATSSGVISLDWKSRNIRELSLPPTASKNLRCIEKGKDGFFWIGCNKGLFILDPGNFIFIDKIPVSAALLLKDTDIRSIRKDSTGRMWLGTDAGLFVVDDKQLQKINSPGDAVSPVNINEIFIDKKETVWAGTKDNGLYQVYAPNIVFQTIPGLQAFSKKNNIQSVIEEKPGMWLIGTMFGLYRYTFSSNRFEEIELTSSKTKMAIASQFLDKNNGYWVGAMGNGVFYRPSGKSGFIHFQHEPDNENSLPLSMMITTFAEDKYENIWMGTYSGSGGSNGLCYYDQQTQKITRIKTEVSDPNAFHSFDVSQIEPDGQGHLWIGTLDAGLHRYDITAISPIQNKFTNYTETSEGNHRISHNVVSCLRPGRNGKVWVGTVSGGMNMVDTRADSISWLTVKNGMPGNLVYRIEEDDQGILWLSTDNGITRFDPATKSFINYNTSSGLPTNNFSFFSSMKCTDGAVAFGTNNGELVYFNPNSFKKLLNTQRVVITDIRLSNNSPETGVSSLLKKSAYLTDTVRLSHDQRVISFEFANMEFINPDVFTYAYKLEGFDKDWNYMSDGNSVTYTNLDPGTYTLLLKQANHLGIWNEAPTKLTLIITPPFWQTWWFFTLSALAIIAVLYFLIREYIKRRLEKQRTILEKKQAIELERNRISTELHDDMGGELSAIRLLSEMNISGISPQQQLLKISTSSGELVQKMNEIVWALNVNNDSLQGLIAYMRRYAVKHLDDVGIDCSFKQPEKIPDLEVDGITRRNIFLLLKETLNNVVKHANATEVKITVTIDDALKVSIHDNGKGISADMLQNGSGNGLRNMQLRVKELKGVMEIKIFEGTTIQFNLPVPGTNTKR